MIEALETISGKQIPIEKCDRRPGDIASMYADPSLAHRELGWAAERDLNKMCSLI